MPTLQNTNIRTHACTQTCTSPTSPPLPIDKDVSLEHSAGFQRSQDARIVRSFLKTSKRALGLVPRMSLENIQTLVGAEQNRRQSRRKTLALMLPQNIIVRREVFVIAKHCFRPSCR